MKRKLLLLGVIPLLTFFLAACGTQSAQSKTASSEAKEASSLKKDNSKLKKQISKHSSSETSSSKSGETNSYQKGQSQTTSQATEQSSTTNKVNNAQDALNAAKAKYGDGNGSYHWIVMYDANTGQPIRNEDGSYFVKAIDPTQGTMTGTAQSVNVYPDGSMTNN